MVLLNSFRTISSKGIAEITVKRSRFIASATPCSDESVAVSIINTLKKRYHDAKHNVSAFRIFEGKLSRFSDDGEPNKTAGLPVMQAMENSDITNCCIVVTRYFGGVLLGTGGLVRAYYDAAKAGIEQCSIVTVKCATVITTDCGYKDYQILSSMLDDYELKIISSDFGSNIKLRLAVSNDCINEFCNKIDDIFSKRIIITRCEQIFLGF